MKLGIVGYANNSGLGSVVRSLRNQLNVECQLVIHHPSKGCRTDDVSCDFTVAPIRPSISHLEEFLAFKPDVVIIAETPFNWEFLKVMHDRGIKVVFLPLVDQYAMSYYKGFDKFVDLWLCPSMSASKECDLLGLKHVYLPFPVEAKKFEFMPRGAGKGLTFLHIAGFWGPGNRKGTDVVRNAWLMGHRPTDRLIVYSQLKVPEGYFPSDVILHEGDFPDPVSMYHHGDVYLAPSRKEGIGIPLYEAMASGMPVIGSDIEPINEVIYRDWLIPTERASQSNGPANPSVVGLHKILMSIDEKVVADRSFHSRVLAEEISWCTLRDSYKEVLRKVSL